MRVRVPERHFPSAYAPPSRPPVLAKRVAMRDGALIAAFAYTPEGAGLDAALAGTLGSPILMLHGNGEEHGIFGAIIDIVTDAGHWVLAIDSRAQGKSTRGTERFTYELMAADALAVADALSVDTFHILGFSDGAIEGLILARDHPTRVLSATLLGANLTPEGVLDEGWDMEEVAKVNGEWITWANTAPADVDPSLLTPTPEEATITAQLMRLMLEEPHIDAATLTSISCPTTVMVGEFDCIRDDETVAIVRAIQGARLVVVPGCGHTLPKHAPKTVADELLRTIELSNNRDAQQHQTSKEG